MGFNNVLEVAAATVAVYLVLAPFPVQLAPTLNQGERHRRQTDNITPISNEAVNAVTGFAITVRYLYSHTNFTSTYGESSSNVTGAMCDLLAYHDLLVETTQPSMNNNATTDSYNASQDLLVLLQANIRDTCTWLQLRQGASDAGSTSGEGNLTCNVDQLRLYCITRRLSALILAANLDLVRSIQENDGVKHIPLQCLDWIDNNINVPQMKQKLTSTVC